MVSQRLKKHANELVYLQKARPCIRNHLITKADRSLVDCLCECADNILRGNVPLTNVSDWVADVKKGLHSLYVYCPLVEPRMVGDAQVPLLRIVPVEGRDGEMITRVLDPIQYCPLLQRRFQTVEIDIRDDTGSLECHSKEDEWW
jgi:hypothetical protein